MAGEAVMKAPLSWTTLVEEYVSYRRKLGFALTSEAETLMHFAKFAEKVGHEGPLTIALASQWACSTKRDTPLTWADRIQRLRGFAKYCQRYDSATEIPPRQMFGIASRRLLPHIFTEEEILALLDAASSLRPKNKLRPITCRTLFGLLASTGLRISEALNLTRADVDLDGAILTIREAKRHKQRLVPVHPTVVSELRTYARARDRMIGKPLCDYFFMLDAETRADSKRMSWALRFLCKKLGWTPRGEHHNFRLYDFRHVFIVRCFLHFHQKGMDVHKAVLSLSTYVGHSDVASTYWYVTGIPELMSIAAERFHDFSKEGLHE
jgi:integrase